MIELRPQRAANFTLVHTPMFHYCELPIKGHLIIVKGSYRCTLLGYSSVPFPYVGFIVQ